MEIFSFYCNLMKKLELIRFTLNYINLEERMPFEIEFHK